MDFGEIYRACQRVFGGLRSGALLRWQVEAAGEGGDRHT